jgi:hypothetical protein
MAIDEIGQAREVASNNPLYGAGGTGLAESWSFRAPGAGNKGKARAPSNDRNGFGCDAQSRYPSDRAN